MEETTIKNLISKDCQQITHPIYLWSENTKDHWKLINNWLHDQEMHNKFVAQNLGKHLPDHLEFNVLFKLSLKSLKRFGCIRKSWALLLENPNFTNLLRFNLIWNQNSCFDDTSLLLCLGPVNNQIIRKSSLYSLCGNKFQNLEILNWPNPHIEGHAYGCYILGSSSINGIICLYLESTGIVYLWNPSTNECKVTPPSPTEDIPYYVDIMIKYEGFGYDWARDDYKVIRNVCYFEDGHLDGINYGEWDFRDLWEIYSLRSNSWRKLNIELLNCQGINDTFYLKGMCHWLCNNDKEGYLVSFDISNEVCYTTLTPLDIPIEIYNDFNLYLVRRKLFLLNGFIALMSNYNDTTIFYISILVEVGKKETWTKIFTIGPLPSLSFPIGTSNMGNILFQTNDGELAWFDLRTNLIEKLGVNVHKRNCQIILYKKSLSNRRINT